MTYIIFATASMGTTIVIDFKQIEAANDKINTCKASS